MQLERCDVFTGKESFDESKWCWLLIEILVASCEPKHQQTTFPKPVGEPGMFKNEIEDLKNPGSNVFYKSLLKILLLTLADPNVLSKDVVIALRSLQQQKGHLHLSVLAVVSKLLGIYEEQTTIPHTKSFKYLPFQRAIPFFPDYGCHVTIAFPNEKLTQALQRECISLLKKMTGK